MRRIATSRSGKRATRTFVRDDLDDEAAIEDVRTSLAEPLLSSQPPTAYLRDRLVACLGVERAEELWAPLWARGQAESRS